MPSRSYDKVRAKAKRELAGFGPQENAKNAWPKLPSLIQCSRDKNLINRFVFRR